MDLQRLEELARRAIGVSWKVDDYGRYVWGPNMEMIADWDDEEGYVIRMRGTGEGLPQRENAEFIVELVNAFPTILKRLRAAEVAIAAVKGMKDYARSVEIEGSPSIWHDGPSLEKQRDTIIADYEKAIKE